MTLKLLCLKDLKIHSKVLRECSDLLNMCCKIHFDLNYSHAFGNAKNPYQL
jgi:hypothetical protein